MASNLNSATGLIRWLALFNSDTSDLACNGRNKRITILMYNYHIICILFTVNKEYNGELYIHNNKKRNVLLITLANCSHSVSWCTVMATRVLRAANFLCAGSSSSDEGLLSHLLILVTVLSCFSGAYNCEYSPRISNICWVFCFSVIDSACFRIYHLLCSMDNLISKSKANDSNSEKQTVLSKSKTLIALKLYTIMCSHFDWQATCPIICLNQLLLYLQ